jgi:type IV fimbrial biogenesis protein FimT
MLMQIQNIMGGRSGLVTLTHRVERGVTLIEMLIGLVVLSTLLALAAPSFALWMQNTQIRTGADAVLSGLQLARTEAIRRNTQVQFVLGNQTEWTVSVLKPFTQVQYRPMEEGSSNVTVQPSPVGSGTVTFDAMGGRAGNNDGSNAIDSIDITSNRTMAGLRPLRIVISPSGSTRMCDPDTALQVGDPRRCTQ